MIKTGRVGKQTNSKPETKTVIFVPQTENSRLVKMLREEEVHMVKATGYRVKYVEQAGKNLGSMLVKSNPWAGMPCGQATCLLCATKTKTGQNLTQDCTKRNLTYQTWCQTCLEKDGADLGEEDKKKVSLYTYIGETAKSARERGGEHV